MLRRAADSRVVNETDEADESEPMLRAGLARLAWNGLKCMAWLVAVILALEWFMARERPAEDRAMRVFHGELGLGGKSLKVSPNGVNFATTDMSGHVALWDANSEWGHTTLFNRGGYARTTTFSPDGRYLVSGGSCITIWDLTNEGKEQALPVPVKSINTIEFSPDGRALALGVAARRRHRALEPGTK